MMFLKKFFRPTDKLVAKAFHSFFQKADFSESYLNLCEELSGERFVQHNCMTPTQWRQFFALVKKSKTKQWYNLGGGLAAQSKYMEKKLAKSIFHYELFLNPAYSFENLIVKEQALLSVDGIKYLSTVKKILKQKPSEIVFVLNTTEDFDKLKKWNLQIDDLSDQLLLFYQSILEKKPHFQKEFEKEGQSQLFSTRLREAEQGLTMIKKNKLKRLLIHSKLS